MKFKTRAIYVIAMLMPMIAAEAWAGDAMTKVETLTIERCIAIALKQHPVILAARDTIRANESRVGQAKASYYPQISWTNRYTRSEPATSGLGVSGRSLEGPFNDYSSAVMLNQNIFDFGRTATQIKIQTLAADSAKQDLSSAMNQVVFNVKQAYYGLLQAMKNRDVGRETVNQFQQHLDQAAGLFKVGVKPRFDVIKAEVDLSNAKLSLLTAENNVRIARITLNNAMGVSGNPDYLVEDNLAYEKYEITFAEALKKAYQGRPDLLSVLFRRDTLAKQIDLAKKGYYPTFSGDASYGYEGRVFPLDNNWLLGATLSFPLFSGFLTKYQVEEARANLDVQKANEDALRQSINLEVGQAYLNLTVAVDKIAAAELTVRQAKENSDIANGRYAAGVGNPIEVTDALVSLSNAKTSYIAALYDYKVARASLEKAMGIIGSSGSAE